ncbi:DNA topology modulation protein FlaR [Psychrobacillus sp. NPDC096426]|uniref:DNA topology modulation protein FlaR n=1 Tax=Psychrobacillus sp. NPDC096426 TaxID=3364491 RepID=UPI003806D963
MKIYIVGSVGSGKTTLARKVSAKLQVPHFETDNFVWTRHLKGDIRNEIEVRDQLLQDAIILDHWVIEGVHKDWTDPGLQVADQIIFLDFPSQKRVQRIVKRYIYQLLRIEKANYKPTFSMFLRMFKWNKYFEEQMKPEFIMKCNVYDHKLYRFQTDKEVKDWFHQIQRG